MAYKKTRNIELTYNYTTHELHTIESKFKIKGKNELIRMMLGKNEPISIRLTTYAALASSKQAKFIC